MSAERYYWRSDPASEPMQLPHDWTRTDDKPARGRPSGSGLARFLRARVMKNDVARAYFEAERQSKIALRGHQQVPALRAAGALTLSATIVHVHDTRQTINDDPVLVLTVDLDGRRAELISLVPRIAVPRPGERVTVIENPEGSTLSYAGLESDGS